MATHEDGSPISREELDALGIDLEDEPGGEVGEAIRRSEEPSEDGRPVADPDPDPA